MAKVYGLWYGGSSWSIGDPEGDLEEFPSIQAAADALRARRDRGDHWSQDFAFVNREPESVYCPVVGADSEMHVYLDLEIDDDGRVLNHGNGPDRVIRFGPRDGVIIDRS